MGEEPLCALSPSAQTPSASVCVWRPVGSSIQTDRIDCAHIEAIKHIDFHQFVVIILTFRRSAMRREPTGLKWALRHSRKRALGRPARRPGRASLLERLCCRQRCVSPFCPASTSQPRAVHTLFKFKQGDISWNKLFAAIFYLIFLKIDNVKYCKSNYRQLKLNLKLFRINIEAERG